MLLEWKGKTTVAVQKHGILGDGNSLVHRVFFLARGVLFGCLRSMVQLKPMVMN